MGLSAVSPSSRNTGIDCLRGLAILLVVIHHLALRFPLTATDLSCILPERLLRALNWDGGKGVTLFFVISGFLITSQMIRCQTAPARLNITTFMTRRLARIMPCLLLLIALLCILGAIGVPGFMPDQPGQSLSGAAFSALFMHLNLYEAHTGYLPAYWDVLWSLSVEELFYLGFPLICLTCGRYRGGLMTCAVLLALSAPWFDWSLRDASEIRWEKAYGPGMSAIATGVVAALIGAQKSLPTGLRLRVSAGCFGLTGLCACLFWGHFVRSVFSWGTPLFFNISIAVLVWSFVQGWGASVTSRYTVWIRQWGQRSYEIYLSHMFVIMPLVGLARMLPLPERWGWVLYPPALMLAFGLGTLIERFFSQPLNLYLRQALLLSRPAPVMR